MSVKYENTMPDRLKQGAAAAKPASWSVPDQTRNIPPWGERLGKLRIRLDILWSVTRDKSEILGQLNWKVTVGELNIRWREDLQKG